jgi:5-formyltetrahydrofolate cyclo-ligase
VSFYFANDGEIDPHVSLRRAAAAGTVCLVPVLPAPGCRRLRFAEYVPGSPLVTNRFGIPEPRVSARALYDALELDAVLVPLVAFDIAGNRLGMGGGFYDATLALRASWTRLARPKVIGLAHECQRVERIDVEPWDIPLDRIATDETVHLCRRGGVSQSMDERRC